MKFAVIKTGGKQYKISEGDALKVERVASEGGKITFNEVLLVDDGKDTKIGTPMVSGATVTAMVVSEGRAKKIEVIKYKPKSRYFKKRGHRQPYTEIRIEKIQ